MNANVKKWVRALRSGKYKQGRMELKSAADEYCCLGVACDLAVKAGVIKRMPGRGGLQILPPKVRDWLGLTTRSGNFRSGIPYALTELNDQGKSFEQIARIIERKPKGLFQ